MMAPGLGDWLTDRLARRPSGALGRMLYRNPVGHALSFRLALERLELGPQDRLLEVGCGAGVFMEQALDSGCTAVALDHSAQMLAETRRRNARAIAEGRLSLVESDAAQLGFERASYTKLACLNAFFFMPDPVATLRGFARVLAPGGRAVIFTAPPEMERMVRLAFGPIARRMRFDSPEDLTGYATEAGFARCDVHTVPKSGLLFTGYT
ncbi:MAG: methyltransferase domain-containing protein [Pseudomonadota bacterium]